MKIRLSIKRFGITIGVFGQDYWNDISKTDSSSLPYILGRFYSYKNELEDGINCGFEILGQFVDFNDAKIIFNEKSKYLR